MLLHRQLKECDQRLEDALAAMVNPPGEPAPANEPSDAKILLSLPGVGKVRARQIMERLQIAETRRVRGLGANQLAALDREFGDGS